MKKVTFVLILLLMAGTMATAQRKSDRMPYAYGHTLDITAGPTANIGGNLGRVEDNLHFGMRYAYFPGKHWGGFFDLSTNVVSYDFQSFIQKLDGKDYAYSSVGRSDSQYQSASCDFFLLGGIYRHDIRRWSFRPRFGAGLALNKVFLADRYQRTKNSRVENVYFTGRDSYQPINAFGLGFGLQVNYSVGEHFFFCADLSSNINPVSFFQERKIYEAKAKVAETWVEAVLPPIYRDAELISTNRILLRPGSYVSFNVGLGWYIGFNRIDKKKYSR